MKRDELPALDEEKLGYAMVRARLLTDNQLKTSLDYQRSLGGALPDVVVKLGFVRPPVLSRFLAEMDGSEAAAKPAPASEEAPHRETAKEKPPRREKPQPAEKMEKVEKKQPLPQHAPSVEVEEDGSELPTDHSVAAPTPAGGLEIEQVLQALIQLLLQKGVIQREELDEILCTTQEQAS